MPPAIIPTRGSSVKPHWSRVYTCSGNASPDAPGALLTLFASIIVMIDNSQSAPQARLRIAAPLWLLGARYSWYSWWVGCIMATLPRTLSPHLRAWVWPHCVELARQLRPLLDQPLALGRRRG